jgi:hypothetical protein
MVRVRISHRQRIAKHSRRFLEGTRCFLRFCLALPGSHSKFAVSSYSAEVGLNNTIARAERTRCSGCCPES